MSDLISRAALIDEIEDMDSPDDWAVISRSAVVRLIDHAPAAASPALTREALIALVPDNGATFRGEPWLPLSVILTALGTPPPAPTSTRDTGD